jgi:hypothetical protein
MKLEDYKNRKPLTTPEGYFIKLNSEILKATSQKNTHPRRKEISINARMRWIGYAATIAIVFAIAVGVISAPYRNNDKHNEMTAAESTGYDTGVDSEFIDNMLDNYPINEYTFYCYLTDTDMNQ